MTGWKNGKTVRKEGRKMAFPQAFLDELLSRSDIVDFLWDNQLYVDDNALSVNITRIREKLASLGLTDFIKTKHRQGYTI